MSGSSAVPLLLLPGLLCDERIWAAQADAIRGRRVIPIPGYGDADHLTEMARRVLAIAPPVFALAGHSMGGRVALEILRAAPRRVERLALLSTGIHMPRPGEREKRHALLELGRTEGAAALVDRWLPPMVRPARRGDAALMAPLRAMCIEAGVDQFAAQITALLTRPECESLLPRIRCPTLVAVGRDDIWSPVDQHETIAAAIPGAELNIIEDAGHMVPVESPDAVSSALAGWLDRPANVTQ